MSQWEWGSLAHLTSTIRSLLWFKSKSTPASWLTPWLTMQPNSAQLLIFVQRIDVSNLGQSTTQMSFPLPIWSNSKTLFACLAVARLTGKEPRWAQLATLVRSWRSQSCLFLQTSLAAKQSLLEAESARQSFKRFWCLQQTDWSCSGSFWGPAC